MSNEANSARLLESRINNIQGIFAADLAEIMIREGLLGAPLRKTPFYCGYFTQGRNYTWSRTYISRCFDLPCWVPSFLTPEVWFSAVNHFRNSISLFACLSQNLLPVLDDPDSLFHYLYHDRPLIFSFLDRRILDAPIRITRDAVFQFDKAGVYQKLPRPQTVKPEKLLPWHSYYHADINCPAWISATRLFHPGMTLTECLNLFLAVRKSPDEPSIYTSLERLVQSVSRPSFERIPENRDLHTFDRIRLEANLATYLYPSFSELSAVVRRMKPAIDQIVFHRLEQNSSFRKFGVPTNFLRVSDCFLRRDRVLEYIFELKPGVLTPS